MIHNLYKHRGETPLECIQRFRAAHPEYKDEKWTYLGRLDPMAEGVLLAATGEDIQKKQEFLDLDKEYEFVAVFGFATDSYDILGKILRVEKVSEIQEMDLIKIAKIYEGEREQKYPLFSSKNISALKNLPPKVLGSPRYTSARLFSEDFSEPKKITIHKLNFHKLDELKPNEFFGRLLMDISKVKGDFRQHEILVLWKEMLAKYDHPILISHWSAHVSSGTYIRSLVNDMGNTLGCGACALSIKRNKVGNLKIKYEIKDSLK